MHAKLLIPLALISPVLVPQGAYSHDHADGGIPEKEYALAAELGFEGPVETTGISDSKLVGTLPMDAEFEGMKGYVMRVRELTLSPGGKVAVHRHTDRMGVAYVLKGTLVEHRNDVEGPLTRVPGDASFEKDGTVHWWANESEEPATVLVVDLVKSDP